VRHQDDRDSLAAVQVLEHVQHFLGGGGVQVPRGFVRQQDAGVVDEGAGDGYALLLAAGELGRGVVHAIGKAHQVQQLHRTFAHGFHAEGGVGVHGGHHHVFQGGGAGEQVEVLEDEADALVPERGALCGVEFGYVFPGDVVMAGGGAVQAAQDVHQGGLSGTGSPREGDEFPLLDVQGDALEHLKVYFPQVVHLGYVT